MDIQKLTELLETARSNSYTASNSVENAASYAKDAESEVNDLYYELDRIVDNLEDFTGFNPEVLRDLRLVQKNLLKAAAFAGKEIDRIVDGDGVEEDKRWSYLTAILNRVFQLTESGDSFEKFDESYEISYDFGTGAYIVQRQKEENNG